MEKPNVPHNLPFLLRKSKKEAENLSLERIFRALVSLGLSQTDARVYIYLATEGTALARNIVEDLKINIRQVYRSLKHLQNKCIIKSNNEHPTKFSALPFEKVLDMLIELKEEQAQDIKNRKKEFLSSWQINKK